MEKSLPKGWVESNIGTISEIIRGVSYKKNEASSSYSEHSIYILRGGNIQDGRIDFETDDNVYVKSHLVNPKQYIQKDDVVIVGSTGSKKLIGKAGTAGDKLANVSFGAFLMLLRTYTVNSKYHSYFFQTAYYRNTISELAGGVNINNIRKEHLENLKFPLPPLPEQERIVAKLDKLFAQHEKIKQALDRIPQLLKAFRQQVLTQAVTGKLTEQWREGKDLEGWKAKKISELGELISGFAFKSSDFKDAGIQLIRMGNLYNNKLDLARSPIFLPKDYDAKLIERYSTQKGDILLSLTGTKYKRDYGFAIEIDTNEKLLINQRILCVRPSINSKYLLYLLRDNIFRDQFFALETGGVNQGNVGVTNLAKISLKIPPLQEQQEIVRRVENLFAKADAIEARYDTLKAKVDSLPQAILHKAFKGELVPQLPTDGDAKDLLAEIMALKKDVKERK